MIRQAFNRAGAKPEGVSGNDFLEAILLERPDLQGKLAYFPGDAARTEEERARAKEGHRQGGPGHTVFIGDEVFKGPKLAKSVPEFDSEHEILKQLEGKGLSVPEVTCVGKNAVFYGMKRISGMVLPENFMSEFTDQEQRSLAADIVGFMVGLAQALPPKDGMCAVYTDMQPKNILVDPDSKRLVAIVDFARIEHHAQPIYFPPAVYAGFNDRLKSDERIKRVFGPDPGKHAKINPLKRDKFSV